jgi:hypothetical protein
MSPGDGRGQASGPHPPVHAVEKAYRWADHLAGKLGRERASQAKPPGTAESVIGELEALAAWCDALDLNFVKQA